VKNPAAGGGRWVEVPPERLVSWVDGFARRHGGPLVTSGNQSGAVVTFTAADRAEAECHPPFPPLRLAAGAGPADVAEALAGHAAADRAVGVLLVRLGGYAVGVFTGSPPGLVTWKTGQRPVHGRSAAGGRSQHRFARRRENQAAVALAAAAEAADQVFGRCGRLDAVQLGGDKRAIAELRGDPRLTQYFDLASDRFLAVPDPRLAVLRDTARAFLATRIRLTEPEPAPDGTL
jgi:Actinobacteria/chloroflexi VLRF1 release factor